jgi:hypothetical protein
LSVPLATATGMSSILFVYRHGERLHEAPAPWAVSAVKRAMSSSSSRPANLRHQKRAQRPVQPGTLHLTHARRRLHLRQAPASQTAGTSQLRTHRHSPGLGRTRSCPGGGLRCLEVMEQSCNPRDARNVHGMNWTGLTGLAQPVSPGGWLPGSGVLPGPLPSERHSPKLFCNGHVDVVALGAQVHDVAGCFGDCQAQ